MMEGQAVLAQACQGRAAPDWQVLPARPGRFVRNIAMFGVAAVVLVVLLILLAANPNEAVTPGSSIDSDSVLTFWRTVDFIVGAALVLACVGGTILAARDFDSRHSQMLVLMPDGFVMQTSADPRSMRAVGYAAISGVNVSVMRGEYTLTMPRTDGHGFTRIRLDDRFGAPKQIVQRITTAQAQFSAARMRG